MKMFPYKFTQNFDRNKENPSHYELGKIFNENRVFALGFNIFSQNSLLILEIQSLKIVNLHV
jgi:hypothetical protein